MNEELYEKKLNEVIEKEKKRYNYDPGIPNHDSLLRTINEISYRTWEFNQIIGYLKLFRFGDRIDADFWKISRQRLTLNLDNKYFELVAWYPEWNINIRELKTSKDIFEKLVQEIPNDMTGFFKKYYIDMNLLQTVGPFINWLDLLNSCAKSDN